MAIGISSRKRIRCVSGELAEEGRALHDLAALDDPDGRGFAGGDTRQHLGRELLLSAAHHHQLGIEVGGAGIDVVGAEQRGVAVDHAALGMHAPTRRAAAEIGALRGQAASRRMRRA